jgi:hypothetical protein
MHLLWLRELRSERLSVPQLELDGVRNEAMQTTRHQVQLQA